MHRQTARIRREGALLEISVRSWREISDTLSRRGDPIHVSSVRRAHDRAIRKILVRLSEMETAHDESR